MLVCSFVWQVIEQFRFSLQVLTLPPFGRFQHQISFQSLCCASWVYLMCVTLSDQSGAWTMCRSVPNAFHMLFRVRSRHAEFRDEPRNSYIVLRYYFMALPENLFMISSKEIFPAPRYAFPGLPTRKPGLQFPQSVMYSPQLCLLPGPSTERSERKEQWRFLSHSWINGSSGQREGMPSL